MASSIETLLEKINSFPLFELPKNEKSIAYQAFALAWTKISPAFSQGDDAVDNILQNTLSLDALRSPRLRNEALVLIIDVYKKHPELDFNNLGKIIEQLEALIDIQIYIEEFLSSLEDAIRRTGAHHRNNEADNDITFNSDVLQDTLNESPGRSCFSYGPLQIPSE